jgi:hypothetical protein
MPRGDKSSYSNKQKRQAEHIEKGYERRGVSKKTAKARAWATVNKSSGGGQKEWLWARKTDRQIVRSVKVDGRAAGKRGVQRWAERRQKTGRKS